MPNEPPFFLRFDPSFARLPAAPFYAQLMPTPVREPKLLWFNQALWHELSGDEPPEPTTLAAITTGNIIPAGAMPLAQAYAGHQFGHFTMLGDGRALLMGETINRRGQRRDLQWKGSGRTPFSRRGDGRAALGPIVRECLVSEALAALGVPTTRCLAAASTGESVERQTALPGAVLIRVAASHLRIGNFEYLAAHGKQSDLQTLTDYAIARHFPDAQPAEHPALALLDSVVAAQAKLIARWMSLGFVHGVMNTDNVSIAGETLDFGPCAFLDSYVEGAVFSSIDTGGRYAYDQQPDIAYWNLARLAECLLPLLPMSPSEAESQLVTCLERFPERYHAAWLAEFRAKLGLLPATTPLAESDHADSQLINRWLQLLAEQGADFTNAHALLAERLDGAVTQRRQVELMLTPLFQSSSFNDWYRDWQQRLHRPGFDKAATQTLLRQSNPALIPRNQEIEAIIASAYAGDWTPMTAWFDALTSPFLPAATLHRPSDRAWQARYQTFCGT